VSRSRPRPLVRTLALLWLALSGLIVAGLAAELGLRIDRIRSLRTSARFRSINVFFANTPALNAASRSLWLKPWFKYRPGARTELVVGAERFLVEINSRGYRTHEFAVPKPPGLVRVVCIGGSTTVAGRTNEETYPAELERMLRKRHPGLAVEVLNLGVSGVTTEHWLARIDRVLALDPDVIVQYQGINDIAWRHLPRFASVHPLRRWAYRSLLVERLFPFPVDEIEPELARSFETLGKMADICHERRIGYLLGSFAAPDLARTSHEFRRHLDVDTEFWTQRFPLRSAASYAAILARYNQLFVAFVGRRHLPHVLVHRRLTDPALFIDSCHFTPEGIRRLAETLLPGVEGLIRDAPGYRGLREGRGGPDSARTGRP
jgi:lysophospholipase L1-like esterase